MPTDVQTLGPYELYRRLGAGATAEVFLASGPNPRGAELLALKVMLENLADAPGSREVFLKEARTSALLRHRHVVEIYEVGEARSRPFIAMELVRGWSLSQLAKKQKEAGESFAIDEACDVVRQAALGLHYIHEVLGPQGQALGLIHRDVSPQNLIVDEQGVVKVVDFGLAKATAEANHTTGLKGKLRYMAPEQLKGEGLDRRVDVFALGAVLWELVCGGPLHPGPSEAEIFQQAFFNPQPHPDEVKRGLPRAVVEVLQGAVHRDRGRRLPSAAALAEALAPLSGVDVGSRISARVQRHFERLPRSRAELEGLFASPRAQGHRGPQLPAPPGRVEQSWGGPTEVTEPAVRPEVLRGQGRPESPSAQTLPHEQTVRPPTEDAVRTLVASSAGAPRPSLGPEQKTDVGPGARTDGGSLPGEPTDGSGLTLHPSTATARAPSRSQLAARPSAATWAAVALLGLSLVVAGFALGWGLFRDQPLVSELPSPAERTWRQKLAEVPAPPRPPAQGPKPPPEEPGPPAEPGPAATAAPGPSPKKARALATRPPRRGGKGRMRFITSEPAEVFIGKRRYGLSNELLVLPSGRHRVEVIIPGGTRSAALEVDVVTGTSSEVKVALEP